jgi:hypothetical protein
MTNRTPSPQHPRMMTPNHFGLGLGFLRGGGWYRRRFDFDLGMSGRLRFDAVPA